MRWYTYSNIYRKGAPPLMKADLKSYSFETYKSKRGWVGVKLSPMWFFKLAKLSWAKPKQAKLGKATTRIDSNHSFAGQAKMYSTYQLESREQIVQKTTKRKKFQNGCGSPSAVLLWRQSRLIFFKNFWSEREYTLLLFGLLWCLLILG